MSDVGSSLYVRDKAAARLSTAARTRNRGALLAAAQDYVVATPLPHHAVYISPFFDSQLGAALLTGAAPRWSALLTRFLRTTVGPKSRSVVLASLPEDDLYQIDLVALFDLRLLAGDWRELPAGRGTVNAWMRPMLRRQRNLLAGFARRDAKLSATAIRAFIRADGVPFSLLGYALYVLARRRGLALKIPRKYDF